MRFTAIASFICLMMIQASALAKFAFEKRASEEKIQALLGLSMAAKIERVQSEGILVRHVEFKNPQMIAQFLSPIQYPGLSQPEIRLSSRADDWSLVHEYMHALFAETRPVKKLVSYEEYDRAVQDFDPAELQPAEYLKLFTTINTYKLQQLKAQDLEELTIEYYLRGVYLKQKPKEFSAEALEISASYIHLSGLQALGVLKEIKQSCADLNKRSREVAVPSSAKNICTMAVIYTRDVVGILSSSGFPGYEHLAD